MAFVAMERLFEHLHAGHSLSSRLRATFMVLVTLLLIPALVSVTLMTNYAYRYHGVIQQVERVASLKPIVRTKIPDEMWYIVAGHKTFPEGSQYQMIDAVNDEIDALTSSAENIKELIVARRTMDTLTRYVNEMGRLMQQEAPIAQSEALLEEVRNVSALVSDMLGEYVDAEIGAAAATSDQLQGMLMLVLYLLLLLLLITLAFALFAQRSLSRLIRLPIEKLEQFASAISSGNLQARAPETQVAELCVLTDSLNRMAERLQTLIEDNWREQENLKKAELRTLQAQIAPHFLYNTLDAIVWLAESERSGEVITVTRALSDFFRISLSQGKDFIPLSEEVKHLLGYLTIQKTRYRDILDYEINLDASLYPLSILKLLLQPLVENAIYHGIKHRRGRGCVQVRGYVSDGFLVLTVADNGAGMSPERLASVRRTIAGQGEPAESGYGLYNVAQRMRLYYSQPSGIEINSNENGTTVSLRVPVRSASEYV